MILLDTSLWIATFKKDNPFDLETLGFGNVVTCLPVIQEVLQGFKNQKAFRIAEEAMKALPIVESPLSADVFDDAVDIYRSARRQGKTVRSSVDCLIAACALRHDLEIVHRDRDFNVLREICGVRSRNIQAE